MKKHFKIPRKNLYMRVFPKDLTICKSLNKLPIWGWQIEFGNEDEMFIDSLVSLYGGVYCSFLEDILNKEKGDIEFNTDEGGSTLHINGFDKSDLVIWMLNHQGEKVLHEFKMEKNSFIESILRFTEEVILILGTLEVPKGYLLRDKLNILRDKIKFKYKII
jgi:hypothetical protein